MPLFVELVPTKIGEAAGAKAIRVPAVGAAEILRNSEFYKRKPSVEAEPVVKAFATEFAEMSDNDLKLLIVKGGGKFPRKTMTRAALIELARDTIYGAVAIVEETAPEPTFEGSTAAVEPPTEPQG